MRNINIAVIFVGGFNMAIGVSTIHTGIIPKWVNLVFGMIIVFTHGFLELRQTWLEKPMPKYTAKNPWGEQ